jgi:hypothetical protein
MTSSGMTCILFFLLESEWAAIKKPWIHEVFEAYICLNGLAGFGTFQLISLFDTP